MIDNELQYVKDKKDIKYEYRRMVILILLLALAVGAFLLMRQNYATNFISTFQ